MRATPAYWPLVSSRAMAMAGFSLEVLQATDRLQRTGARPVFSWLNRPEKKKEREGIKFPPSSLSLPSHEEVLCKMQETPAGMAKIVCKDRLAQDSLNNCNATFPEQILNDGLVFMGYPYLAELYNRPEVKKAVHIYLRAVFRDTPKISRAGHILNRELEKKGFFEALRAAYLDGLRYGHGLLYIRTAGDQTAGLTARPLGADEIITGYKNIEPYWCTPSQYNATRPTNKDYYRPTAWTGVGGLIDGSRIKQIVPYPVCEIFKPAFQFGGQSIGQLMLPYLHNYLRIRNSNGQITANYSKLVLKTDMSANLQTGGMDDLGNPVSHSDRVSINSLTRRANALNTVSDAQDIIICDKESEDVAIVSASLSGLEGLAEQAYNRMYESVNIPEHIFKGNNSSGLGNNSTNESQWHEHISSVRETLISPLIKEVLGGVEVDWGLNISEELKYEAEL